MYTYEVMASHEGCKFTHKTNNVLEVLPMVRELWNEGFRFIDVVCGLTGEVLLHIEEDEEKEKENVYMTPEMKLMWNGFFFTRLGY